MLLGSPSSEDEEELQNAPIPKSMLNLIGWARGLRLLVRVGLPPLIGLTVFLYVVTRLATGHDLPLEMIGVIGRLL